MTHAIFKHLHIHKPTNKYTYENQMCVCILICLFVYMRACGGGHSKGDAMPQLFPRELEPRLAGRGVAVVAPVL